MLNFGSVFRIQVQDGVVILDIDLAPWDHKSASVRTALRKDVITYAATVSACEKAGFFPSGECKPFTTFSHSLGLHARKLATTWAAGCCYLVICVQLWTYLYTLG